MRRLYGYMLRYRWRYVFGLVCLLVTASVAMVIPYFLKRAVEVIEHDPALHGLRFYVLLIIGLAVLQGVARTFSRFVIFNIGRDIEYDLRNDLFAHMQTLSTSFYQRSQTGNLMSRLVNDIGAVRMMIGPGILELRQHAGLLRLRGHDHGDDQRAADVALAHRVPPRAVDREAPVTHPHGAHREGAGRPRRTFGAGTGEPLRHGRHQGVCARELGGRELNAAC